MEKLLISPGPVHVTLITAGGLPPGQGDFHTMVTAAFDGVIDLCGAQRGLLRLLDKAGGSRLEVARSHRREWLSPKRFESVEPVLESALRRPGSFLEDDFVDGKQVLRSAVIVPMMSGENVCGAVYLDRRGVGSRFPRQNLWPLEWFAQMIAVECSNDLRRTWRWRCLNVGHLVGLRVA